MSQFQKIGSFARKLRRFGFELETASNHRPVPNSTENGEFCGNVEIPRRGIEIA